MVVITHSCFFSWRYLSYVTCIFRPLVRDCLDDELWASTIAKKVCPEHSSVLCTLLSEFSDVVEFLMATVKFRAVKEKLKDVKLDKVKKIKPGRNHGSVRLTSRKLAKLTREVQTGAADDSAKELVQKVKEHFNEKFENPKKVKRRKNPEFFSRNYKRKSGDELRLVQKREIVSSII